VRLASTDAAERTAWVRDSTKGRVAEVMPWLEAMSIRGFHFGPNELRRQIQGVYDAGLKSWSLWNPGSSYSEFVDALRPAAGTPSPIERRGWVPPKWTLPRERLSMVIRKREQREQLARAATDSTRARADAAPPRTTQPDSAHKKR
jgi:hypothetical protein